MWHYAILNLYYSEDFETSTSIFLRVVYICMVDDFHLFKTKYLQAEYRVYGSDGSVQAFPVPTTPADNPKR